MFVGVRRLAGGLVGVLVLREEAGSPSLGRSEAQPVGSAGHRLIVR